MDKEEIAKYIRKELKKKADDVIVNSGSVNAKQIKFSNNKMNITQVWDSSDIEVFASFNKKLVTTNLKDFSKEAADEVIRKLVSFAEKSKANNEYMGIAKGPFKYKKIEELYDEKITDMDEKLVDYAEDAINKASEIGAKRCSGILETSSSTSYLLSSNNVEAKEKGSSIYFSIRCFTDKDASGHSNSVSRTLRYFNPIKSSEFAADIAVKAKNPKTINAGKYDILFEPLPFACILQHVGESASIFNVEAGLSFLNKLNEKVANENVTIYDDGILENGFGSSMFDGEGVPRQKTIIVDKGILKNYLHNYSTAKRYKVKSTGNAGLIAPEPTNIIMEKGNYSKEEMFKEIKRGLYITNTWYTRFKNFNTGDFSTIPRDGIFYIENGEIKYPVKEIRISENILNMLKNVKCAGKELENVYGWEIEVPVVCPSVLVKDVNISKSVM